MAKELALVTGGAGFIGSHLVDALIRDGYAVKVLDNLSRPTHNGKLPPWFNKKAEFVKGDIRKKSDWEKALEGVRFIFHLAGYMDTHSDFSTYFTANAAGTALMYEVIVEKNLPVKKIIAASSQSVYGEGKYYCHEYDKLVYPDTRSLTQLKNNEWEIKCPLDGCIMSPLPELESDILKPVPPYGASKVALEQVIFTLGKLYGIPSVALRYSIAQGARQSFRHFYSGALRSFVVSGLAGTPIPIHEDGKQLRDFVSVHDLVEAHLTVLKDTRADFEAFNVGRGISITVLELAAMVAETMDIKFNPNINGQFRWATVRHSLMDSSKLKALGWKPKKTIKENIKEYISWVTTHPESKKYLDKTIKDMKEKKMLF